MDRNKSTIINCNSNFTSLSARRAWIEIGNKIKKNRPRGSLSARRAWIEMSIFVFWMALNRVALRKESVDRNRQRETGCLFFFGSLSARRAWIEMLASRLVDMSAAVALRKESVDRNNVSTNYHIRVSKVALRKESVDRNMREDVSYNIQRESLSARRAWIEIIGLTYDGLIASASLSARRAWIEIRQQPAGEKQRTCRSPQGERG